MNVKDLFKDNASIILDGLGICGFISAEILISKQTPVALKLCKENKVEKKEINIDSNKGKHKYKLN